MFAVCRGFLVTALTEAGVKTKIYTSFKKLQLCQESHVGAVLFEKESLNRNGSKKIFKDEAQEKHKRRKVLNRSVSFNVIIGDYGADEVEAIYEKFLSVLPDGLYIDGNYVAIEPEYADWMSEGDNILKSKLAVQLLVRFDGGVYKDTDFAKLRNYAVDDVITDKEDENNGENQ